MKSIWIARTKPEVPEDMEHFVERHPEKEKEYTKLLVCYDEPYYKGLENTWYSRVMAEAPSYMFPEIEPGECVEFKTEAI